MGRERWYGGEEVEVWEGGNGIGEKEGEEWGGGDGRGRRDGGMGMV
jgi:hypothetical protein